MDSLTGASTWDRFFIPSPHPHRTSTLYRNSKCIEMVSNIQLCKVLSFKNLCPNHVPCRNQRSSIFRHRCAARNGSFQSRNISFQPIYMHVGEKSWLIVRGRFESHKLTHTHYRFRGSRWWCTVFDLFRFSRDKVSKLTHFNFIKHCYYTGCSIGKL